jgi:hypothetical protein
VSALSKLTPIRNDRPRWGAVSIAAMWLSVLFIGLFGGDIYSTSGAAGSAARIPAAVAIAVLAFFATLFVARRAFSADADAMELRSLLEEERHARERLEEEVSLLRQATLERSAS